MIIRVEPKYNPTFDSKLEPNTLLGPGIPIGKFLVGSGHGLQTWDDLTYADRLSIARNLVPQVELITSVNGRFNEFSQHRLGVVEGVYFSGEGETVGGLNTTKQEGRTVVYGLYDRLGRLDPVKTFDLALFWKDYFDYQELILSYDTINPDGSLNVNVIVTMPTVGTTFDVSFSNSVSTYFNNTKVFSNELVYVTL